MKSHELKNLTGKKRKFAEQPRDHRQRKRAKAPASSKNSENHHEEDVPGEAEKTSVVRGDVRTSEATRNDEASTIQDALKLLKVEQTRVSGLKKLLHLFQKDQNDTNFIKCYLQTSPQCKELFLILEGEEKPPTQVIKLLWNLFEKILLATSDDETKTSSDGIFIVNRILGKHLKHVYSALNPLMPTDVNKATLKLLTSFLAQGRLGVYEVINCFDFTLKSLEAVSKRRDYKEKTDVRTCFIRFFLAFLMFGDLEAVKQILELPVFKNGIFNGLFKDRPATIHLILSTLLAKVVNETGLLKKTKIAFFNSYSLMKLAHIYVELDTRADEDNEESSQIQEAVKDMIMKIFTILCTEKNLGICFPNEQGALAGRSNNPVLLKFLHSLKKFAITNSNLRELITKTLSISHDLVIPFVSNIGLNLEPRPSLPWNNNMSFLTEIWSGLPPLTTLLEPNSRSSTFHLQTILKLVFPTVINKVILTNGLKHKSTIVQHKILTLMALCMKKAVNAAKLFSEKRPRKDSQDVRAQFCDLVMKQLPEVNTLVSMWHSLSNGKSEKRTDEMESANKIADETGDQQLTSEETNAEIKSSLLDVMRCYQELRPGILTSSDFNICKLFASLNGNESLHSTMLCNCLAIALMEPIGSLKWFSKKSELYSKTLKLVFDSFAEASSEEIVQLSRSLIIKLLRETGMFNESLDELNLWLAVLSVSVKETQNAAISNFLRQICSSTIHHFYEILDQISESMSDGFDGEEHAFADDNFQQESRSDFSPLVLGALRLFHKKTTDDKEDVINLDAYSSFLTYFLKDLIMSRSNPAALLKVVNTYDKIFMGETESDSSMWKRHWKELNKFISSWSTGVLFDSNISKSTEKTDAVTILDSANQFDTFSSLIRKLLHVLSTKPKSMQISEVLKDFNTALLASLKRGIPAAAKYTVKLVLNCLRNLHRDQTHSFHKSSRKVACYFLTLLKECVSMLRMSQSASLATELPACSGISASTDAGFEEICIMIMDSATMKRYFLDADSEEISALTIEVFEQIFRSETVSFLEEKLDSYYDVISQKIFSLRPVGSCKEKGSRKHLEADTLKALICFSKVIPLEKCERFISTVIDSLIGLESSETYLHLKPLLNCLKVLLSRREEFTQLDTRGSFLKRIKEWEAMCKYDTPDVSIGQQLTKNIEFVLNEDQICGLLSLLVKHRIEELDEVALSLIHQYPSLAMLVPTTSLESLLKSQSSSVLEIILHMIKVSPNHAVSISKLICRNSFEDKNFLLNALPALHALLFIDDANIEQEIASKVGEHLDDFIRVIMETSWTVNDNEKIQKLGDILIVATQISKNKDSIVMRMQSILKGIAAGAITPNARYPLYFFEQFYLEYYDHKHFCTVELLVDLMEIWERALRQSCDIEVEHFVQRLITEYCEKSNLISKKERSKKLIKVAEKWSSLLKIVLKNRLRDVGSMLTLHRMISLLYSDDNFQQLSSLGLKTIHQYILSHSKFLPVLLDEDSEATSKDALLDLLLTILHLAPDVCEASHVQAFLTAYNATMASSDRKLQRILKFYEDRDFSMLSTRPFIWGKAALENRKTASHDNISLYNQTNFKDILESFDRNLMMKSAFNFPLSFDITENHDFKSTRDDIYDPTFLLPLFSYLLGSGSEVDCRHFIETGCLAVTVSALSSEHVTTRKSAYHILARFSNHLELSRFREKNQIVSLLTFLQNTISEEGMKLSSITCCFLVRSFQILLKPDHHFYPIINNFIVEKPCFNPSDVPLFIPMLNSSDLNFTSQRSWMLKLLVSGLRSPSDYYVYKRKHVFELLLSLYDSPLCDKISQKSIADLIITASQIHPAAFDLVKQYSLLSWLHFRVQSNEPDAHIFVLEILSNLTKTFKDGPPKFKHAETRGDPPPIPLSFPLEALLICVSLLEKKGASLQLSSFASAVNIMHWCIESSNSVLPTMDYITSHSINKLIFSYIEIRKETDLENSQAQYQIALQMAFNLLKIIGCYMQQCHPTNDWQSTLSVASFSLILLDDFRSCPYLLKPVSDIVKITINVLLSIDACTFLTHTISSNFLKTLLDTLLTTEAPILPARTGTTQTCLVSDRVILSNQDSDRANASAPISVSMSQHWSNDSITPQESNRVNVRANFKTLRSCITKLAQHILSLVENAPSNFSENTSFQSFQHLLNSPSYSRLLESITS